MGAAGASLAVTLVAVMGGFGVYPVSSGQANASGDTPTAQQADDAQPTSSDPVSDAGATEPKTKSQGNGTSADATESQVDPQQDAALPDGSGTGKRVVFSESRQRVWLVTGGRHVRRTYLVSGSAYDNLDPGTYEVYSRSEQAWGVDGSGTMRYFVRFTQGDAAAIGFHDIPVYDGKLVQSPSQLGTPLSHGCIRQRRADARLLWRFAPLGTPVVVTT
jgi:hypothetical protein